MSNDALRDDRKRGFYITDNEIIDRYGPIIGYAGIAVYSLIVRYADGNGENSFPSYPTIAKQLAMSRTKVIQTVELLANLGLIKKETRKDKAGDLTSNLYTIIHIGSTPHVLGSSPGVLPSTQNELQVVHQANGGSTCGVLDQNTIKKTPVKKTKAGESVDRSDTAPTATSATPPPLIATPISEISVSSEQPRIEQHVEPSLQSFVEATAPIPSSGAPLPLDAQQQAAAVGAALGFRFVDGDPVTVPKARTMASTTDTRTLKAKAFHSPHVDASKLAEGRIPTGQGSNPVEVWYERHPVTGPRLTAVLEDDLMRDVTNLIAWRAAVKEWDQSYPDKPLHIRGQLDRYENHLNRKESTIHGTQQPQSQPVPASDDRAARNAAILARKPHLAKYARYQ